jgi:hypothetical protein
MAKVRNKRTNNESIQQALEEEHRIRKAFKDKDWAEIKSSDSWMIFKVMSEFVEDWPVRHHFRIGPREAQPSLL